jgi:hypothetical protein
MGVVESIGATLEAGVRELKLQEMEKRIRALRTRLHEQETSWYREGTHALISHWCKDVDLDGDYLKK